MASPAKLSDSTANPSRVKYRVSKWARADSPSTTRIKGFGILNLLAPSLAECFISAWFHKY
jgi:hypothetical protein